MYEGHFHLERRPFAATPDPGCCYLSPTQTPLFQTVGRCIESGQGISILTGPAGIGKTLLVQVLLAESAHRFTTVYLGTGQFPTRRALLQAILYELGQPYGGMTDQELRLELNTALRNLIAQRDGLLLILDEAHLLSDRLLEEVRLLADLAQHGVPLVRVVLSGNPEFEERLTAPALAAFNQRVACHVALETLTQQESISYLEYRIQWAGGSIEPLFERDALKLIAYASDGVPRCLNQLADHSLLQAYLAGASTVTAAIVRQALADVQQLPLRWNPSALHDRSVRSTAIVPSSVEVEETSHSSVAPLASADDAFEVGATDERETACFEFGAGDGASSMTVPAPAGQAEIEEIPAYETDFEPSSSNESPAEAASVFEFGADTESDVEVEADAESDEDEDGPPLFAWLAKPKKTEPEVTPTRGNFSSSSFTIPTRGRTRSPAVEQEVVSTAPLAGVELVGKRAAEPLRVASPVRSRPAFAQRELPPEEVVVDGYARLDARSTPMFPRPAPTLPTPVFAAAQAVAQPAAEVDELFVEWPAATATATLESSPTAADRMTRKPLSETIRQAVRTDSMSQPLERIDSICALLEESEEHSRSGTGVELITDYGVERIDVDLPANAELPAGVTAQHRMPVDLENWIGSTVVEVGRDLQQNMATSFPELVNRQRANKLNELLEDIQRASQYDVVEPDAAVTNTRVDPRPEVADSAETSAVPAPNHNFKNFFSMLRRRQTR